MTENNNTKDSGTGLTEEEVISIEESWSMLYRKERRKGNGINLFVRYTNMCAFEILRQNYIFI
jgi:hypothetical protein